MAWMNKYTKILSASLLYTEYIIDKKSMSQIARVSNYSVHAIKDRLIKYNIPIRTISEAMKGKYIGNKAPGYIDGRTNEKYYCIDCDNKISYNNWLYGNRRCRSCAREGKNNPNFRGGLSNLPYSLEFNKVLKESIRIRDNHQCQICGKLQSELKDYHKKLSIHHIDYDKKNFNFNNLITLCPSCHMESNYNREIYIEYFSILKEILK